MKSSTSGPGPPCATKYCIVRYWPNPAHKVETTEAGPPVWIPNKEKCPRGMTVAERNLLLAGSVAVDPDDIHSRRFAVRRTERGLEFFDVKWTQDVDGVPEFHGHPASRVDRRVLKVFRERGLITEAEYNRFRKELPGC